ncbi:hypothetical protein J7384_15835 [Endozoicomonas sp. G2_1]|uniref:hypothetical protein n=1 Tax=Endozoicomonas sp. G2_1 TaxID=2821091 RepID=UPI001ADA8DB0|nr:hypothetical protein [Endozoicomonas sp. G2_1]MBO9491830.1 hypothetical protein [Endozoicomonas sp. G2_1]
MKTLSTFLCSSLFLFGCAATSETPKGWLTLDGKAISDQEKFNAALKKCDYIRADRTAIVDFDGKAMQGLLVARLCMEKEGYQLKK